MRTAFVTGASSGMGLALARRFAAAGMEVALAARRVDALREAAEQMGGRARVYPLDVTDAQATVATVRRADDEMGGLDLVVANAGVGGDTWAGKSSWEDASKMLAVNVTGALATLTAVLPRMVERRRGHLVGISSLAAYRALPTSAMYSATKAFLSTYLSGLRLDLAGVGIAVTDVRPGFVMTGMHDRRMPLMIEADEAAEIIFRGIQRRAGLVAFPWLMKTAMRSSRLVPDAVLRRVVDRYRRR